MKTTLKMIVTMLIIVTMIIGSMTGCGNSDVAGTETGLKALVLVIGAHGCSKELNLANQKLLDYVSDVIAGYGFVSVICVDGSPSVVSAESYDIPEYLKKASKSKLLADAEKKTHNLMLKLNEVRADDNEVDTLEALRLAARTLDSASNTSEKTIIVIDTGLSTSGLLDFRNNLIGAEPEAITDMLIQKKALPDFEGARVIWQNLGDTASPEKDLSPAQQEALKNIWRNVVERGGGIFEFSDVVPKSDAIGGMLPEVSTVNLPEEQPIWFETSSIAEEGTFEEPVIFGEDQIQFKGDSDIFVDPAKADSCLRPVADYMASNANFKLLLVGTTAGDTDSDFVRDLSFRRAMAVRQRLSEMGTESERIKVMGLGNSDPWHISGAGTTGDLAGQNRKVVLMNLEAKTATCLLQKYQ